MKTLDGFGAFSRAEISAGGALIDYLELTQQGRLPRLSPPRRLADGAIMEIDQATRRNLELNQTLNGERAGSLLSTIDRTRTGAGARALAARLTAPLTDTEEINCRLDAVQHFTRDRTTRETLRDRLRECPDLERALSRLTVGRGGPRDLASVRDGLSIAAEIKELLAHRTLPTTLSINLKDLGNHGELIATLTRALAPELLFTLGMAGSSRLTLRPILTNCVSYETRADVSSLGFKTNTQQTQTFRISRLNIIMCWAILSKLRLATPTLSSRKHQGLISTDRP